MSRKEKEESSLGALIKEADAKLIKDMVKTVHRIERIFVPSSSITYNPMTDKMADIRKDVLRGKYLEDTKDLNRKDVCNVLLKNSELVLRKVNWNAFQDDIQRAASDGKADYVLPLEVTEEIATEVRIHEDRLGKAGKKEKLRQLQLRNNQPIFPGKWRKEPFVAREYVMIHDYVVADAVDAAESEHLLDQLDTPLDGYLGQAYNYDDHGLTEEWMLSFRDKKASGPSDDDVIRTQLSSLLEIMIAQVQDRVCTEEKVLYREPLVLGRDVKETPVWGIDCYTRTMIELILKDRSPPSLLGDTSCKIFIEKVLLPAINRQKPTVAHNISYSLRSIIAEDTSTEQRDATFARHILEAVSEFGVDSFRIHPKGTGVVCIRPEGIPAHVMVTQYLGEVYPPYRWCERLDVIEQAQKRFELKPTLPDFYNILLERPRQDPRGYGLLYVDASQKANIGSSCSHSCEANCTSAVVARNGKLTIVLTTNRHVSFGEELTMDYYSITTSDVEWRAAICLCGMTSCRGSFLHYATQDDLQQVLNQNFGAGLRYASLLRACAGISCTAQDEDLLARHGIQSVALGMHSPTWIRKYVADSLRFIEFERKALPCALLRGQSGHYSFAAADMDARCVMEQRIQSMICCISMVHRVLAHQPHADLQRQHPLKPYLPAEAVQMVWRRIVAIPALLSDHLVKALKDGEDVAKAEMAVQAIQQVLASPAPTGFQGLRERGLEVRHRLLSIEELGTPKARVGQLADMLLLWSMTTNFSAVQEYCPVESQAIVVNARELGTSIPRAKLAKAAGPGGDCSKPLRSHSRAASLSTAMEVDGEQDTTAESIGSPEVSSAVDPVRGEARTATTGLDDGSESSLAVDADEDVDEGGEQARGGGGVAAGRATRAKPSPYLSPNEPVFSGHKTYGPSFCFWQLIGWFNAGTDCKVDRPDLFGCVQLPSFESCFGPSDLNYGPAQRRLLMETLLDDKRQVMPWPAALRNSFHLSASSAQGEASLLGSPMLDTALGQVDAVPKVIKQLQSSSSSSSSSSDVRKKGQKRSQDAVQLDHILPPEKPTNWVQCDGCKKWRRVPWHVDVDALSDSWVCAMNSWDVDSADCAVPQDSFDPAAESTVDYGEQARGGTARVEDFVPGSWRDVYCLKNLVYYEGQVKKLRPPTAKKNVAMVLFHYRGWSSAFDEWIPFNSERIAPHHLFTNPDATDPRAQEIWQGKEPVQAVVRTAFVRSHKAKGKTDAGGRKRKAEEADGAGESLSPVTAASPPSCQ